MEASQAERIAAGESAVLPCGCIGHMLRLDDAFVQFRISEARCGRHMKGVVAVVNRKARVTPADPLDDGGG